MVVVVVVAVAVVVVVAVAVAVAVEGSHGEPHHENVARRKREQHAAAAVLAPARPRSFARSAREKNR